MSDYKYARNQPLLGGAYGDILNNGTVQYFPVSGLGAPHVNLPVVLEVAPCAGIIYGMASRLNAVPAGAASRTFTLYLNAAPTALTVTHGALDQYQYNDADVVAFARGDTLVWHSDGGVGVPNATSVKISCLIRRI